MKKLLIILSAASIAASAQALVVGTDIGYLVDDEEAYFAARVAWPLKSNETHSHQVEAEIGYTETRSAGSSADLLPVTFNYRLQIVTSGTFGYYVGAGAGFARISVDGYSTGGSVRLRDTTFALQGFVGLTYQATPSVGLNLGAKYIWIDDVTLASTPFEVGDDVAFSAGLTLKF